MTIAHPGRWHWPWRVRRTEFDDRTERRIDAAEEHAEKALDTVPLLAIEVDQVVEQSHEAIHKDHLTERLRATLRKRR